MTQSKSKTPLLDKFGDDLTQLALDNQLDPIIGRAKEVHRICQILARRKKNNPMILGDPGVGKTAIVEAIAQRIVNKEVAFTLLDKKVVSISMANLVAGTKFRGEFEERIKNLVQELKDNPDIIIFIDEIHTLVGAGGTTGSLDASNILKPALAKGQIQCIGATTFNEYRENIENDGALVRRFQEVFVRAPSIADTIEILNNIKAKYEDYHNVKYDAASIEACAKLSDRYITQRELPDKAIDLLDETGAKIHLAHVKIPEYMHDLEQQAQTTKKAKINAVAQQDYEKAAQYRDQEMQDLKKIEQEMQKWKDSLQQNKEQVSYNDIAQTIAENTGIPIANITENETKIIKEMESQLQSIVIGQDKAVKSVAQVIKRARTGVSAADKPLGSFMFIGPTGVGKTELVKALTEHYFGSVDNLIRFDMSEYQEKFNSSRLIGAPPGYVGYEEGGQLTEAVRRQPYSVILFDEIEKAHPDTFNTLLQVLDEGQLTDSLGTQVDFTNTVIIMTSNIGARKVADFGTGIGFQSQSSIATEKARIESIIRKELKNKFTPEFLNRVDDVVLFDSLSEADILKIIDLELEKLIARILDTGYQIKLTKTAKKFLARVGYDQKYGARPLKRAIQTYVEDILADAIIDNKLKTDKVHTITKDPKKDKLYIKF